MHRTLLALIAAAAIPLHAASDLADAPPDWWRAVFLHQTLRRCDLALPCYERALPATQQDLRARTLWGIAYCSWIMDDPVRSEASWRELVTAFPEHPLAVHARAWALREVHSGRSPRLYRHRWRWTYRPPPLEEQRLHNRDVATIDPGPGPWTLHRVRLHLAVHQTWVFAPWSGTPDARPWPEGPRPFTVVDDGPVRIRVSIACGEAQETLLEQVVELTARPERAWTLVGEDLGLRRQGPWQVRVQAESLPLGIDVGVGCSNRYGIDRSDTGVMNDYFYRPPSVLPNGEGTTPQLMDAAEDPLVHGQFHRFAPPASAAGPQWRLEECGGQPEVPASQQGRSGTMDREGQP